MRLLVTGSSGFVGRATALTLAKCGFIVRAFSRTPCEWTQGIEAITAPAFSCLVDTPFVFEGVDCVLHLAGRAHVMNESDPNPIEAFRKVNVFDTLCLARQAALAGVRRFVFVSSIKVNGECTFIDSPFTEADKANPLNPYALSKYEAELGLLELASQTGMEVVIVRPPLIYGPGVKGNFQTMTNLLTNNVPIPLAMVNTNQRSLVSLDNFINFLSVCCIHPEASGRVLFVSDQQDVSTAELLRKLALALGTSAKLFPVPPLVLKSLALLASRQSFYLRLCGSLSVDSSATSHILGWSPPFDLDEGLRRAVAGCFL